jgi:phage terminase large subunit-like protein
MAVTYGNLRAMNPARAVVSSLPKTGSENQKQCQGCTPAVVLKDEAHIWRKREEVTERTTGMCSFV